MKDGFVKVSAISPKVRVADPDYNVKEIIEYIEKEYRISNKNKNTVDYYDAWIKDNKGNVISIDIEKIPKEYIIDGLRNI